MTKEHRTGRGGATVPSSINNSVPGQSQSSGMAGQGVGHPMIICRTSGGPTARLMDLPQQHMNTHDGRGRPRGDLRQPPEQYILPPDVAKISKQEICRDFAMRGNCRLENRCPRSHVVGGGRDAVATTGSLASVLHPGVQARQVSLSPQIQVSPTVRIVGNIYTDRLNQTHRLHAHPDSSATAPMMRAPAVVRSIKKKPPAHSRHEHPPPPPPPVQKLSFPPPPPLTQKSSPSPLPSSLPLPHNATVQPENLDVERLSRAAELDPRPSRRMDVVCQWFQKGRCYAGELCPNTHIYLLPQECITQLLPPPPKPVARKIPATIRHSAPDGSIHEREVCKLGARGLCRKGDSCRYVHLSEAELDRPAAPGVSENREPQFTANIVAVSNSGSTDESDTTKSPARKKTRSKPRAVCRMYFRKQRCYKLPCRYSHDVLDLADQLPPQDDLVMKHADAIRDALKKRQATQSTAETSKASTTSQPPPVADTAKKRQKKPSKPGTDAAASSQETDDASSNPIPRMSKGKGRAEDNSHVYSSKNVSMSQKMEDDITDASSRVSYHSVQDSCINTQTGITAEPVTSHYARTVKNPCFEFILGRCKYLNCRSSHDIDEAMRWEFHKNSSRPQRASGAPVTGMCSQQAFSSDGPVHDRGDTRRHESVNPPPKQAPMVPPGLGLEMQYANARTDRAQTRPSDEAITITVLDSTKATFGPGFVITHIITGFECRQIILQDVPDSVKPAALTKELEVFGSVTAVIMLDSDQVDDTATFKVTFGSGEAAGNAVAALKGRRLFEHDVTARLVQNTSNALGGGVLNDGDVLFELPTPCHTGFVGYTTEEFAEKAIEYAQNINLGPLQIIAEQYQGIPNVGTYNVRFRNIPPHFTADDVKKHFVDRFIQTQHEKRSKKRGGKKRTKGKQAEETNNDVEQTVEICEGVMIQRGKYNSLQGAFQGLKRMLQEYDEDVSINVLPPPYRKFIRVWAHFSNADMASKACAALDRYCPRFVGKGRIFAAHYKTMRYQLPSSIFDVLKVDIDLLRSYIHDDHNTTLSVIDKRPSLGPGASVIVKLVSRNMESLTKAKATFEHLLRGEKVKDNGKILWNDYFASRAGQAFLQALEKENPTVKISGDVRRRTIALFGVRGDRERVRDLIVHRVRALKSELTHRYPVPDLLIGVFMSADLVDLQRELGHDNVWFDLSSKQLVIRGDEDVQKVAQLAILHVRQRYPRRNAGGATLCPVCLDNVSHPVTLACGHTWCKACLAGYLNASVDTKTFPLTCLADSARCAQPIALATAQRLLSTEEFDRVVHAAFAAHVQQRPAEFHYCPTPDCPQIYRTAASAAAARAGAALLQCPSCLVRVCAHCNAEAHENTSCQAANPEDEELFELWKTGHDVKHCPHCKVPIERAAGCNHMTCVSCKIHICWACLATFAQSGEVYEHMRSIHGGIGL
uniref:Uncharacterized protein n=1 Tax=Trametes gibbosa TaxID=160864 RepID=A0A6G6FQF7_9APHY|nr:hypothetical protein [Trametes gibbosa]